MGRPSNSRGSGGAAAGDEERLPLRAGLETERAPSPSPSAHHGGAAEQPKEARRGGTGNKLWRASVRAGLVLCLLSVPAVLLLLRWQADSSPQWVFDFEAPEGDDDQGRTATPDSLSCDSGVVASAIPKHAQRSAPWQRKKKQHDASLTVVQSSPATDGEY